MSLVYGGGGARWPEARTVCGRDSPGTKLLDFLLSLFLTRKDTEALYRGLLEPST